MGDYRMNEGVSKWYVGFQSTLRSLLPVAIVLAGLEASGILKSWSQLLTPAVVLPVLAALLSKGASSVATAKDVTVKT